MLKKIRYLPIIFIISLIILGGFGLFKYFFQPPSEVQAQGWYAGWQYRKPITIDNTQVATDLSNFPALISLNSDSDLAADAQDDGDDIVFTSSDGTTKLDHEIETFDGVAGQLVAWVRIPSLLGSTDTDIYMYYGNSGVGSQQNPSGVWSNGYEAVYHLHDDFDDSTGNGHNGTNYNSSDIAGRIADAQNFHPDDGVDYIDIGSWSVSGSQISVQCWASPDDFNQNDPRVITKAKSGASGTEDHVYMLSLYNGTSGENRLRYRQKTGTSDTSGTTTFFGTSPNGYLPTAGTWYLLAITYDGSNMRIIRDGFDGGSTTKSGNIRVNSWPINIGNHPGRTSTTGNSFDGQIDEVRISSVARSLDWLRTEYNNQNSPSLFYSLGSEELEDGDGPLPPSIVSGWAWAGGGDLTPNNPEAGNGWISFNCTNTSCGSSNYEVNIGEIDIETEIGEFFGYAWAGGGDEHGVDVPTLGWISFNRSETGDPPQDDPGAGSGPIAVLDYNTKQIRGWMRALANGDGWDGWIKLGDSTGTWPFGGDQVKIIDTAAPHIKEFGGWAWGGDVIGWISFSCENQGTCTEDGGYDYWVEADINFPPEAIDLDYYFLYCIDSLHPYLTWTYSDFDPEDFQTAYQVQIVSPLKLDTGEVYSSSGKYQVKVADMVIPGDNLEWNTTYSWRVKVRDNYGAWSAWSLPSIFTTPTHPYPDVDFTWSPKRPSALESISFFDDSTCYDDDRDNGTPCSDPNDSFFWDFDANGLGYPVNWDWDKGDARYLEFPVVSFSYPSNWQIKLEVTDSHGIPFTCSKTRFIKVSYPLPDWKEVIPR